MMRRESGFLASWRHDLGDLVDVAAVGRRPGAPLHAVDRAEVAVRVGPFVPDRDAVLLQPARRCGRRAGTTAARRTIERRCTFLVVTSGKPSRRSKRIW